VPAQGEVAGSASTRAGVSTGSNVDGCRWFGAGAVPIGWVVAAPDAWVWADASADVLADVPMVVAAGAFPGG